MIQALRLALVALAILAISIGATLASVHEGPNWVADGTLLAGLMLRQL